MAKDYAYSKMDSKLVALLDRDNDQINIWSSIVVVGGYDIIYIYIKIIMDKED